MKKCRRGFTLTEVLIVVVIIGVLAALTIPRFMSQDERALTAEAVGWLGNIRDAENTYRHEQVVPSYTTDQGALDVDAWSSSHFTYTVTAADADTFTAQATRNGGTCNNETITLNQAGVFGGTHPFGPTPGTGDC